MYGGRILYGAAVSGAIYLKEVQVKRGLGVSKSLPCWQLNREAVFLCMLTHLVSLSAPTNLMQVLKAAVAMTWVLTHGSLIRWNVRSLLCSVQLLYCSSLLSLLSSGSFVRNNEMFSFLLQYFFSGLFYIWKLDGISADGSVICLWMWISVDLPNVRYFILCFEGLPAYSTSLPLPAKQLTQLCKLNKPPEQLNWFILVSIHPGTCQDGDGREGRLWMCWSLSEWTLDFLLNVHKW